MKFQCYVQEQVIYKRKIDLDLILVWVCVDDLLVIGTSVSIINKFKQAMETHFDISDLGILPWNRGVSNEGKHINHAGRIYEEGA